MSNDINDLRDIDVSTKEGRYLIAALAKLTTESQTDKTPYEVLEQCGKLEKLIYPPQQETQDGWMWTDELVKEYGDWFVNRPQTFASNPMILVEKFKQFKSSKQQPNPPKEERIEVMVCRQYSGNLEVLFKGGYKPTEEKLPLIKEAIEQIINSKQ